jgi:hypothetical protein
MYFPMSDLSCGKDEVTFIMHNKIRVQSVDKAN